MSCIYKITNDVNGKIYVGKTNFTVVKRFEEHLNDYKRKRCEKRSLYEAMNKYGIEHFHIEILEEVDNDKIACEREQYWINELRTYIGFKDCNGYNATLGGDSKKYKNFNVDDIVKMYNETHDVKLISKKYNLDRSYVCVILRENNVKLLSGPELYVEKYGKRVYQTEINTLNIINIFESRADANRFMNKDRNNGTIYDACNARRGNHHAHGYDWYCEEDYLKLKNNINS